MIPLKTEFIKLTKSEATKGRLLVGIDSGNSLTKIIFINKCHKEEFLNDDIPTITLQFSLFHKRDFESALQYIKMNAFQLDDNDYKIHLTGVHALSNGDKIKSILNKDFVFVEEPKTVIKGYQIALELIGIENIIENKGNPDSYGILDNEIMDRFTKSFESKFRNDNPHQSISPQYPCLFYVQGSCTAFVYFDHDAVPEILGISFFGGKSWLGLAKCILDTNDYNEIVDLASRGDRVKIDTVVKEFLDETTNSPYGKFPPYFPIFTFGKCADYDKGTSEFSREDMAHSLVSFNAQITLLWCLIIGSIKKLAKIYVNGNVYKSDVFQKELEKISTSYPGIPDFLTFINFGYFGALGAAFLDETS